MLGPLTMQYGNFDVALDPYFAVLQRKESRPRVRLNIQAAPNASNP